MNKIRLAEADKKITEYESLKTQRQQEVAHANDVMKRAQVTVAEIETQRNIAENLASDDKALALIEEMASAGTVTGVYGRLGDLIESDDEYSRAIEAAAAGWMKAIVVRDVETAVACIEVLKKTKIGRVKLVPLEDMAPPQKRELAGGLQDILGPVSEHLKFEKKFRTCHPLCFWRHGSGAQSKSGFPSITERDQGGRDNGRPLRTKRSNGDRLLQTTLRSLETILERTYYRSTQEYADLARKTRNENRR